MKKAAVRYAQAGPAEYAELEQLPNVGPAIAADLRLLGFATPEDLRGRDPYVMYEELCRVTKRRHDPCVLDTFLAVVRFVDGEPARPWWAYTEERKRALASGRRDGGDVA